MTAVTYNSINLSFISDTILVDQYVPIAIFWKWIQHCCENIKFHFCLNLIAVAGVTQYSLICYSWRCWWLPEIF
jgi:hypothetical protein